jgi:glycerol-3-phosphate acyltransferase PlsY
MQDLPLRTLAESYAAFLVAYLIGSLSFAVIVSKLMGLNDPRTYGSGNPGATNVLRSGNKKAAVLTLLLDGFKGWLPVFLVQKFAFELRFEDSTVAFVGVAAFIGHLWPVFFKFKGGKGVATAAGVLLGYEPLLGLAALLTWGLVAAIFRYSSLAALVTAVFAPIYMVMFFDRPIVAMAVAIMSLLLIWRHAPNIVKLMTGKESRLGEKPREGSGRKRRRRTRRLHDDVRFNGPAHRATLADDAQTKGAEAAAAAAQPSPQPPGN